MHVKFEVLIFNRVGAISILHTQKLGSYVTLATQSFRKMLRGRVRTVPGNMRFKFEVRIFNRFKLV